jgi:hypothetical protein
MLLRLLLLLRRWRSAAYDGAQRGQGRHLV